MKELGERIIEFEKRFAEKEREPLPKGLSQEELTATLIERTQGKRAIYEAFSALLKQELFPILENCQTLTDEQTDELIDIATRVFRNSSNEFLDPGLSRCIHAALERRARLHEDHDRLVCHLYWHALSLFYLNATNGDLFLFFSEMLALFEEAASYTTRYADLHTAKSREYVNRCLGNVFFSLAVLRHQKAGYDDFFAATPP